MEKSFYIDMSYSYNDTLEISVSCSNRVCKSPTLQMKFWNETGFTDAPYLLEKTCINCIIIEMNFKIVCS